MGFFIVAPILIAFFAYIIVGIIVKIFTGKDITLDN